MLKKLKQFLNEGLDAIETFAQKLIEIVIKVEELKKDIEELKTIIKEKNESK
jgi:hypothetical protein